MRGLEFIRDFAALKRVDLEGTKITDAGLAMLADTELESLRLAGTRISEVGLRHIEGMHSLKKVNLNGVEVPLESVERLRQALPGCSVQWEPSTSQNRSQNRALEFDGDSDSVMMPIAEVAPESSLDESRYIAAMKPIEDKAVAWDFTGADQESQAIRFDEISWQKRLEARRNEIRRMEALKRRAIEKLVQAKPPLKKSDLQIRGIGGTIVDAGPAGITTKTLQGKTERLYWKNLGTEATAKLMELAVDPKSAEDLATAALLTLASGDEPGAERFFKRAREAGADVSDELGGIASNELAAARALFAADEYEETLSSLERIKKRRADLPWYEENRDAIDALTESAAQARDEAAAEKIYTQAVALLKEKRLFDLRDAIQQLEADYGHCPSVMDSTRSPLFADLKKTVADLGARLTVRADGEGMFRSIQAAIDAAGPDSLIEIQDSAIYDEALLISEGKLRLTIRGSAGCWPVVTCSNATEREVTPVKVHSNGITISHMLFVRPRTAANTTYWIFLLGPHIRLRDCLVCNVGDPEADLAVMLGQGWGKQDEAAIANCVLLGGVHGDPLGLVRSLENCLILGRYRADSATFQKLTVRDRFETRGPVGIEDTVLGEVKATGKFDRRIANSITSSIVALDNTLLDKPQVAKIQFRDPANLDFRLVPGSPGAGMAADGGDIGCRYTPEMLEMCRIALELRARGMIKF